MNKERLHCPLSLLVIFSFLLVLSECTTLTSGGKDFSIFKNGPVCGKSNSIYSLDWTDYRGWNRDCFK